MKKLVGSSDLPNDAVVSTDVNGTKIQVYAAGRMSRDLKIDFSSNPVLPESEILTLLALGLTQHCVAALARTWRIFLH